MPRGPIRNYGRTVVIVADSEHVFDNIIFEHAKPETESPFCSSDSSHTSNLSSTVSHSAEHSSLKHVTRQARKNKASKKIHSLKPKSTNCSKENHKQTSNRSSSLFHEDSSSLVLSTPIKKKKQQNVLKDNNSQTFIKHKTKAKQAQHVGKEKNVLPKQMRNKDISIKENVPDFDDIEQDDLIIDTSTPRVPEKHVSESLRHNVSLFNQSPLNVSHISVCENYDISHLKDSAERLNFSGKNCVNVTFRRCKQISKGQGQLKKSEDKRSLDSGNLSDDCATGDSYELADCSLRLSEGIPSMVVNESSVSVSHSSSEDTSASLCEDFNNLSNSFHMMRLRSRDIVERLTFSSQSSLNKNQSLQVGDECTDTSEVTSSPDLFEDSSSCRSHDKHSYPLPQIEEEECSYSEDEEDICSYSEDENQNDEDVEEYSVYVEEDSVDVEEDSVDVEEDSVDVEEDSVDVEEDSVDVEEDSVDVEEDSVDVEEDSVDVEAEHDMGEQEAEHDVEEQEAEHDVEEDEAEHAVEEEAEEEDETAQSSNTGDVTLYELTSSLSFSEKLSNSSLCKDVPVTAQERVLSLCGQTEPISFSDCIPSRMMSRCVKIGEGVYGEVFRTFSDKVAVALKIIPIEGDQHVNDCPQKKFDEILPEVVIAKELSDLTRCQANQTSSFCQVKRISCVQGVFPSKLLEQWDVYHENKSSENDRPDMFPSDQLFIVFEFVDGGCPLENYKFSNQMEAFSVLRQVVFALAVAEMELEFEHRDLHIGNVLVRSCVEETVSFKLHNRLYEFPTEGVTATVIDFTISRLKKDGCAVFCDISTDEGLFEGTGDFQFDVYRDMRKENENDWKRFCPHTNVLWVHYICKKFLTAIKYKETGRGYRDVQRHLRNLADSLLDYSSCQNMTSDSGLWEL